MSPRKKKPDPDPELGRELVVLAPLEGEPEDEDQEREESELVDREQAKWLHRALLTGLPRDLAAQAAGIDDLEALMDADPKIKRQVEMLEARAVVIAHEVLMEKRPAFILERNMPARFAPTTARGIDGDAEDDDGGFFSNG